MINIEEILIIAPSFNFEKVEQVDFVWLDFLPENWYE